MGRYTRKYTKQQRLSMRINHETELHRFLNRVDIEKDAFYCNHDNRITKKNTFILCANALFGDLIKETYELSYDHIEKTILLYSANNSAIITVNNYRENHTIIKIPNEIQYGIQDAGLSPKKYNNSIHLLITPGSYLDPCSRSKGDIFYGFNDSINHKQFTSIAFPMINKMKTVLSDDYSCSIHIDFTNMSSINVNISNDYGLILGDIEYFMGNNVKNNYFNMATAISKDKAYKFIICKELGDTIQALYGKLYANTLHNGIEKVCMFTNDKVLMLRCILLHLQVVYNFVLKGKDARTFYHYPVMTEITKSFIQMWISNVASQNNYVTQSVRNILEKHEYLLINGKVVRFKNDSNIVKVLHQYIVRCNQLTEEFSKIDCDGMNLETYRKMSFLYQMPDLFIDKVLNSIVLNTRLFSHKQRDILMDNVQTGGSNFAELPTFRFEDPEEDFTIDREYNDTFEPSVITKHALYTIFKEKDPSISKNTICYIIKSISCMLYLYFGYIGSSTSHYEFMIRVYEKYKQGYFGTQTLPNFEYEYNTWIHADDHILLRDHENINEGNKFKDDLVEISAYGGKRRKTRKYVKK